MAEKIIFTQEQINSIKAMHEQKVPHREIAKIYNTSRSTIDRLLRAEKCESHHPWLTEARIQECLKIYDIYHSMNKTAEILKMNSSTVKYILLKHDRYIYTNGELHRKHQYNETYFDEINTANKAYFLGLLYADGNVSKRGYGISLSLQEQDRPILDFLINELQYTGTLFHRKYSEQNPRFQDQYELHITNKHMHQSLINHGVIPAKSLVLTFPKTLDEKLYVHFIRGYLDGDGCISKNECRCSLVGTQLFCNAIKEILEKTLDIHCSIMKSKSKNTYTLSVAGRRQVKTLLDWLYHDADCYLERKYKIYQLVYYGCA